MHLLFYLLLPLLERKDMFLQDSNLFFLNKDFLNAKT